MKNIPLTSLRSNIGDTVNRVAFGGERHIITRHGKPVAALISAEDMVLFQRLVEDAEDRIDVAAARAAKAFHEVSGEPYSSLDDVRSELGLS